MPAQRLSMRRIKQLLALHFGAGASSRTIGRELGIAPGTVREHLGRAAAAWVGWPLAADGTDESLMARLFANAGVRAGARLHAESDWNGGRHQIGTVRGTRSERPGGFVGIRIVGRAVRSGGRRSR